MLFVLSDQSGHQHDLILVFTGYPKHLDGRGECFRCFSTVNLLKTCYPKLHLAQDVQTVKIYTQAQPIDEKKNPHLKPTYILKFLLSDFLYLSWVKNNMLWKFQFLRTGLVVEIRWIQVSPKLPDPRNKKSAPQSSIYLSDFFDRILLSVLIQK